MPHLRDITDRAELAALVSQLGRWLDTGDDKEGRVIFHEDAIIHSARGGATGIDDILEYSRHQRRQRKLSASDHRRARRA